MNVLLIGSGGREHAIALKITKSNNLSTLFCAPGNPGTENISQNIPLTITDHSNVKKFCLQNKIEFVVIGLEQPLVDGLADYLRNAGIKVFGPSANAAQIESSKSFAKKIMMDAGVPTAKYIEFSELQSNNALDYLNNAPYPLVIKVDGL
ncbi:MAG: phosphoribosylamine--glycine ligase, partial [Ignavibacteria bacterium]|nr:phosphoribosylamine--glycine ligase [Ignavibacteria bacterium]